MINVGVIGGGQIFETTHLPAIQRSENACLKAVCELSESRRNELVDITNCTLYSNIDEMITNEELDAIIVCVPNKFHCEVVIKCLENKINVFCEKPPAISFMEAKEMEDISIANGVKLYYNFHNRQYGFAKKVKEILETNQYGPIYSIKVNALRRRGVPGWGTFTNKDIQGGGPLIDLGIHYLDLVNYVVPEYEIVDIVASSSDLIGKNETVGDFGNWDNTTYTVENYLIGLVKTNKFPILIETSFAHNISAKDDYKIEIFTQSARIDVLSGTIYRFENNQEIEEKFSFEYDAGELRQLSTIEFLSVIYKNKETNLCDGNNGSHIQKIIEELYKRS